jgi:hypothetical protein
MSMNDIRRRILGTVETQETAIRAAEWLCLAAAPAFAAMALLTAHAEAGRPNMLCSAADHASWLSGMVPMYLLMSAFHSPPWLRFILGRRCGARRA